MKKLSSAAFTHFLIGLGALVSVFFFYIQKHNELTTLRMLIPSQVSLLRSLKEENKRLEYQVDLFYNPTHLIHMSKKPEYRDLVFPFEHEVLIVERKKNPEPASPSKKLDPLVC